MSQHPNLSEAASAILDSIDHTRQLFHRNEGLTSATVPGHLLRALWHALEPKQAGVVASAAPHCTPEQIANNECPTA